MSGGEGTPEKAPAGEVDPGEVREQVRAGGLLPAPGAVVVMLSGGRDSVCLLDVAVALCGPRALRALHVNYGLRAEAGEDERHCRALCVRLEVPLEVLAARRPEPAEGAGNLQAWAREVRYREAARIAATLDGEAPVAATRDPTSVLASTRGASTALIATGHTASDQVESVLYRLAASPGRRALLGMAPREGRVVRPLLELTREQTAAYCRARGLSWREDASNDDERYARARVRHGVVPALRAVHPAAEANVLRTAQLLRAEAEVIDGLLDAELDGSDAHERGVDCGEPGATEAEPAATRGISIARLESLPPALARLVVIQLAEDAAGTFVPQAGARVPEILALAERGGRAELHVGGLVAAVVERGRLSMVRLPPRR